MTYQWVRDAALKLIGQYSVAGQEISVSYNNQADYINRIASLADDGQVYIATTAGKIRTVVPVDTLECMEQGAWRVYTLPEDCWQLCSVLRDSDTLLQRYHRYRRLGDDGIAIPKTVEGLLFIEYYRYPHLLGDMPDETALLDNTLAAQMALPYYIAAHLVMHDNAFAYSALYNEFESRLARLNAGVETELGFVEESCAVWENGE